MNFKTLIKSSFVGVGQIFLQNNGVTGLLITISMFFTHWTLGVSCFLGSLIGTLFASICKFGEKDVLAGIYGFNGSLVYMCTFSTFGMVEGATNDFHNPIIWILGAVGVIIATLIVKVTPNQVKLYSFPFVLTCWVTCYLFSVYNVFGLEQTTRALIDHTDTMEAIRLPFYGWAEIDFADNFFNGILIFIAIAVSDTRACMWGTASATVGALFAYYAVGIDENIIVNGIYSFSPILVACAFVGNRFIDFLYVIIGIMIAVLVQYGVNSITIVSENGWATYTIGFVVASWIITYFKSRVIGEESHLKKYTMMLNP